MRALLLAAGVVFAGVPAVSHAPAPVTPAHFRMMISTHHAGYALTCDSGCTWTSLTLDCKDGCNVVIDDSGVYSSPTPWQGNPRFAFRFHQKSNGWQLESLVGTGWRTLGFTCGTRSGCSAEVDETSVRGLGI